MIFPQVLAPTAWSSANFSHLLINFGCIFSNFYTEQMASKLYTFLGHISRAILLLNSLSCCIGSIFRSHAILSRHAHVVVFCCHISRCSKFFSPGDIHPFLPSVRIWYKVFFIVRIKVGGAAHEPRSMRCLSIPVTGSLSAMGTAPAIGMSLGIKPSDLAGHRPSSSLLMHIIYLYFNDTFLTFLVVFYGELASRDEKFNWSSWPFLKNWLIYSKIIEPLRSSNWNYSIGAKFSTAPKRSESVN